MTVKGVTSHPRDQPVSGGLRHRRMAPPTEGEGENLQQGLLKLDMPPNVGLL